MLQQLIERLTGYDQINNTLREALQMVYTQNQQGLKKYSELEAKYNLKEFTDNRAKVTVKPLPKLEDYGGKDYIQMTIGHKNKPLMEYLISVSDTEALITDLFKALYSLRGAK